MERNPEVGMQDDGIVRVQYDQKAIARIAEDHKKTGFDACYSSADHRKFRIQALKLAAQFQPHADTAVLTAQKYYDFLIGKTS